ncbi:c-type cytochrome [Devosia beringensis]|uniref:c-type cytochrome n=1 Tax=Devosia beringensis TaxID=2657486 RepID=UPI00186B7472|nr:cytochrome c [Devosia beringensis]
MTSAPLCSAARRLPLTVLVLTLAGVMSMGALAQTSDPIASLPSSPKDLLLSLTTDTAVLVEMVGTTASNAEWASDLAGRGTAMTPDQQAMLAEYLALNLPAAVTGTDVASMVQSLPPDGRELFAQTCFACHGVGAYYLQQDRDVDGWMDIFSAPYHRRLLTEDKQRETFASYAASAMPIAAADIPAAWQQ